MTFSSLALARKSTGAYSLGQFEVLPRMFVICTNVIRQG